MNITYTKIFQFQKNQLTKEERKDFRKEYSQYLYLKSMKIDKKENIDNKNIIEKTKGRILFENKND